MAAAFDATATLKSMNAYVQKASINALLARARAKMSTKTAVDICLHVVKMVHADPGAKTQLTKTMTVHTYVHLNTVIPSFSNHIDKSYQTTMDALHQAVENTFKKAIELANKNDADDKNIKDMWKKYYGLMTSTSKVSPSDYYNTACFLMDATKKLIELIEKDDIGAVMDSMKITVKACYAFRDSSNAKQGLIYLNQIGRAYITAILETADSIEIYF